MNQPPPTEKDHLMSHAFHDELPGYHPDQLLVDGCDECVARSGWPDHGISSLDPARFAHAWDRARDRARDREMIGLANGSYAELPLLSTLYAVRVQLVRASVRV